MLFSVDTGTGGRQKMFTWTPRMPKMIKKAQQIKTMLPMGLRDVMSVSTTSFSPGALLITLEGKEIESIIKMERDSSKRNKTVTLPTWGGAVSWAAWEHGGLPGFLLRPPWTLRYQWGTRRQGNHPGYSSCSWDRLSPPGRDPWTPPEDRFSYAVNGLKGMATGYWDKTGGGRAKVGNKGINLNKSIQTQQWQSLRHFNFIVSLQWSTHRIKALHEGLSSPYVEAAFCPTVLWWRENSVITKELERGFYHLYPAHLCWHYTLP